MARPASLAEHYRAHRAAFALALELGCTPKEAADELRRREARERDQTTTARLHAKMNAPSAPIHRDLPADAPWMMRD